MAGFRDFQTGEVLTAANVNDFLAKQSVMKFADATARDTALGTATGGSNALREGMVAWLDSSDELQAYDGTSWSSVGGLALGTATPTDGQILAFGTATSTWNPIDAGFFTASTAITATDATWSVPALGSPIVRVTVIGGGGGGGAGIQTGATDGGTGGTTTFNAGAAGTATATGGLGGRRGSSGSAGTERDGTAGLASANGGQGSVNFPLNNSNWGTGKNGNGGSITVAYFDLTGVSTVNVTIGAGGAAGTPDVYADDPGDGGRGEVVFEYKAA